VRVLGGANLLLRWCIGIYCDTQIKWNVIVMLIKKDTERKRALQSAFKNDRPIFSTYVIHEWLCNQLNLQENKPVQSKWMKCRVKCF